MLHPAYAYLPADRLATIAGQRELPLRASGAVLSVDVVGFTRITEAFASALGAPRGAESLAELLNQVYTTLIACVEEWRGSVVSFSGDAMRCWFAGDDGRGAVACAWQIQQAMQAITIPAAAPLAVAVKAAIVSGEVQRFSLGDPAIQLIDTLAGGLLVRLADLEAIVQPGEIIVDEPAALALAALVDPGPRRGHPGSATLGVSVAGLTAQIAPAGAPIDVAGLTLPAAAVQPWLLASIWERLQRGMGDFLTELRPVVALFGQFAGAIDAEDSASLDILNRYVAWVQGVITRYDGVVLQITLGEKGNYFYAAFGALQAHEDDAVRAVCAARDLQAPAADSPIGAGLRVGLASGIMRTGVYGSPTRRTYGVLGDAANLAARLMQHAQPGTILATQEVAAATADQAIWLSLGPITVKGKCEPLSVSRYSADRGGESIGQPTQDQLPMIGRQAELEQLLGYLAGQPRQGHVIALNGEAGIGKSRLISEAAAAARRRGWLVYASECQSYLQNTPYSLWQPLLRALIGIEDGDPDRQIARLETAISAVNPAWLPRLPLLGPIVNLSLPDTELTRTFDAQLRNASREALVVDWLREWVQIQAAGVPGIVLVLEDIHWIDPLSLSLLAAVTRVIGPLPVIILLAHRPLDAAATLKDQLRNLRELPLDALAPEATGAMIAAKMIQLGQPLAAGELEPLAGEVYARTQGNPFYIEELLIYLHENQQDPRDSQVWERSALPASLHQLLLSRIDQLTPTQQQTLKMASVIGRLFRAAWLHGYPALAARDVQADLGGLRAAEMILLETVEPELTYLFRHVIAQEVAYETLAFATRELLHEQLAGYLERSAPALDDQRIYLVAYHYERSANQAKRREYLLLAGRTAQAAYANAAAIRYYEAALPLLDDKAERADVLLRLGAVLELVVDKPAALARYEQALEIAQAAQAVELMLQAYYALGVYYRIKSDYVKGLEVLNAGYALAINHDSPEILKIESELANIYVFQGNFERAREYLNQSLRRQQPGDDPAKYEMVYHILGGAANIQGDVEMAYFYAQKFLELNSKERDILKYSNALNSFANVLSHHGADLERSIGLYEESLAIRRGIGAKRAIAISLYNLSQIYLKMYKFEEAEAAGREAVSIVTDIGDSYLLLHCLRSLGSTLADLGKFPEGKIFLDQALDICETINSPVLKCALYISVASFHALQGHVAQVEHFNRKALALYEEIDDALGTVIALSNLGANFVESGRLTEARELLDRGKALYEENNLREEFLKIYIRYTFGFLALEEGDLDEAIGSFNVSLALAKQIGDAQCFIHASIGLILAWLRRTGSERMMGDWAVVLAMMERFIKERSAYLKPYIQRYRLEITNTIKTALPAETFAAAWERGQSLSMEEAIDHALAIGGR